MIETGFGLGWIWILVTQPFHRVRVTESQPPQSSYDLSLTPSQLKPNPNPIVSYDSLGTIRNRNPSQIQSKPNLNPNQTQFKLNPNSSRPKLNSTQTPPNSTLDPENGHPLDSLVYCNVLAYSLIGTGAEMVL